MRIARFRTASSRTRRSRCGALTVVLAALAGTAMGAETGPTRVLGATALSPAQAPSQQARPQQARPHQAPPEQRLSDPTVVENDLAWLINVRRAAEGLAPLKMVDAMREPARVWAQTMANDGKIYHRTDLAVYPASYPVIPWVFAGENVGVTGSFVAGGARLLTGLDQAFWDSPPHKENVLGPFDHIAIGAFDTGTQIYVAVAFVDFDGEVQGAFEPTSALHDAKLGLWEASSQAHTITLRGWADDADVDRVPVQIRLDGQPVTPVATDAAGSATMRVTDGSSAQNVVLQLPFRASFPAVPGNHKVCASVDPVGFGGGASESCLEVAVPAEWLATAGGSLATVAPGSAARTQVLSDQPTGTMLAVGPRTTPEDAMAVDIELGASAFGVAPAYRVRHRLTELLAVPVGTIDGAGKFVRSASVGELSLSVPARYSDASTVVLSNPDGGQELAAVLRHEDGTATALGALAPMWQPIVNGLDATEPILVEARESPGEPTRWWVMGRSAAGEWRIVDDAGTVTSVPIDPQHGAHLGFFVDSPVFDGNLVAHVLVQGTSTRRGSILDVPLTNGPSSSDAPKTADPPARRRLPEVQGEDLIDIEAPR